MPRYIDIEPFETEVGLTGCCIQTTTHICDGIIVKNTNTKDIPTIDPESLGLHSRWEYDQIRGVATCKNCGFERNVDDNFGREISCPNCGAKMDSEQCGNPQNKVPWGLRDGGRWPNAVQKRRKM